MDIAVDCKMKNAQENVIQECYDWLNRNGGTNIKSSRIVSSDGGETLYIGSRNSEQFGRLYDKGKHTGKADKGLWYRYEVEYKRSMAKAAARMIRDRIALDHDIGQVLSDLVWNWFNTRDTPPIFNRKGQVPLEVKAEIISTSDERKLAWLTSQVSPSVKSLVMSGRGKEVIKALGLESFYVVKKRNDLFFEI